MILSLKKQQFYKNKLKKFLKNKLKKKRKFPFKNH